MPNPAPRPPDPGSFPLAGRVPAEVLALPVAGRSLAGPTLGSALAEGGTLLVFLRHFG